MSAKTSHRRVNGSMKRGGRVEHVELDMVAWTVTNAQGIMGTVYTLGNPPDGYTTVNPRD